MQPLRRDYGAERHVRTAPALLVLREERQLHGGPPRRLQREARGRMGDAHGAPGVARRRAHHPSAHRSAGRPARHVRAQVRARVRGGRGARNRHAEGDWRRVRRGVAGAGVRLGHVVFVHHAGAEAARLHHVAGRRAAHVLVRLHASAQPQVQVCRQDVLVRHGLRAHRGAGAVRQEVPRREPAPRLGAARPAAGRRRDVRGPRARHPARGASARAGAHPAQLRHGAGAERAVRPRRPTGRLPRAECVRPRAVRRDRRVRGMGQRGRRLRERTAPQRAAVPRDAQRPRRGAACVRAHRLG